MSTEATTETAELLALKVEKLKLKRQRLELVKKFGLAYYRPHPVQDRFHIAGGGFKRRMLRAGNRTGKSHMGAAEDIAFLMGERPWYKHAFTIHNRDGSAYRHHEGGENHPYVRAGLPQHPVKLLTITNDWDKVHEIWTGRDGEGGKCWKFLPPDFVKKTRRNSLGVIDTIECANRSLWRFDTVKAFKSNPLGSESSDWDVIHPDEPLPEDMFKANARGLIDRGGSAHFTLTPLSEFWINDYFFPNDTGGRPRTDVWADTATTYDNPYLTDEAIKMYESELTSEEIDCRIKGIPLHLSGLIYKAFKWAKHVMVKLPEGWSDWDSPPLDWPVFFCVDPHPQTPHAVLFGAVSPQGYRFYFKDLFVKCSIADLALKIRGVIHNRFVLWGKMDPLGFINDPITETNMAIEMEDHGVIVEKATKALEQGILRVQGELAKEPAVIQFSPSCTRTLWEVQRYCWDEKENRPIDKDDHMMENLYRAELSEPIFIDVNAKQTPVPEFDIGRVPILEHANLNLKDL